MDIDVQDSLDGQVALVTGATRGIGEAIAAELAELGAEVYAGARNPDDITASDLRSVELDVSVERGIVEALDRIENEAGRLDVLVNNAGVYGPAAPLHENATEDIDATLDVNLHGPVLLCKHALALLLAERGGRVVNVSSGNGQFAGGMGGGHGAYAVTKAGLNALTLYLHGEYHRKGLLANAVCPGWVRTDMGGRSAPRSPEEGAETPVWLARFPEDGPSGKFWRDKAVIEW